MDQGLQTFHYSMYPHKGNWETGGTVQRAAELNQKPTALFTTFHPEGKLPQSDSFIHVSPDNVMVTVLKQSEDGDDLILRAVETNQAATQAIIEIPHLGKVIEAEFNPCEIKTFRIPEDMNLPVRETNLLEEDF
jgi:alpha-mannosidase